MQSAADGAARRPGFDHGGSSGIGHAVALALADAGADAVAVGNDHRAGDARATCEQIEALRARATAIRAHVGVARDVAGMVDEVVERFGGLGVWSTARGTRR